MKPAALCNLVKWQSASISLHSPKRGSLTWQHANTVCSSRPCIKPKKVAVLLVAPSQNNTVLFTHRCLPHAQKAHSLHCTLFTPMLAQWKMLCIPFSLHKISLLLHKCLEWWILKFKAHSTIMGKNHNLFNDNCHKENHCSLCIWHTRTKRNVAMEKLWHHSRSCFQSWDALTQYNTHWLRQDAWRSTK